MSVPMGPPDWSKLFSQHQQELLPNFPTTMAVAAFSPSSLPMAHFKKVMSGRRGGEFWRSTPEEEGGRGERKVSSTVATVPPPLPAVVSVGGPALEICGVDLLPLENGLAHRTDCYELVQERKGCVVRRGGVVRMGLVCSKAGRQFDLNRDRVRMVFEFGSRPSIPKGTKAVSQMLPKIGNSNNNDEKSVSCSSWPVTFDHLSSDQHRIDVLVTVPVDAPVGLWQVSVDTWYGERVKEARRFKCGAGTEQAFYVLFNPFHEDDPVFLPHPSGIDEYLFNETGKLYLGSHNRVRARPWVFGQMRDSVLPAVCQILGRGGGRKGRGGGGRLADCQMGDPVAVVRAVSAAVSTIMTPCHSGNGSSSHWTGSVPILEEYMGTGKPLKNGQCWIFAGLVTTICRSLGIPCRPVTNYLSAQGTGGSLCVDTYFDEEGEEIIDKNVKKHQEEDENDDEEGDGGGVWNFHLWNEVWMSRTDLPPGFDGWQVIDATPRTETGLSPCGPAPVEAVRQGEVGLGFDVSLVHAAVNSRLLVFSEDKGALTGFRLVGTNSDSAGKLIVTKALGFASDEAAENGYQDITMEYKNPHGEGSTSDKGDIGFQMIDMDKGKYGESYRASLFLHNQSKEARTVSILMSTSSVFYNGSVAHLVKKGEGEFLLQPNEKETLTMDILPSDYTPKMVEHGHFLNRFLATVRETGQTWHGGDNFCLDIPRLSVRVIPDTPRVNRQCKITIGLTNPLKDDELTECVFVVEAAGVSQVVKMKFRNIEPEEHVEVEVEVPRSWRSGATTIVAVFNSRELANVTGSKRVNVIG